MSIVNRFIGFMSPPYYVHVGEERFFDLRRIKLCRLTPTLFIVGAQKSGTSSLHAYLDQHPEIFMTKPLKEPGYYVPWPIIKSYYENKNTRFISRSDLLRRGMLAGYNDEKIIGESSTFYTNGDYNISENAFKKNNISIDDVKIIYLMKNPIERIISHYLHALRNNNFEGDINKFVETNPEAIGISCYGKQIETYYSYLSTGQILLLNFDTLIHHTQKVMNRVYDFLGVSDFEHDGFEVFNASPASQEKHRNQIMFSDKSKTTIQKALLEDYQILKKIMHAVPWSLERLFD